MGSVLICYLNLLLWKCKIVKLDRPRWHKLKWQVKKSGTLEFCLDTVLGEGSKSDPINLSRSSWRVLEPRLAEFLFGWCLATGRFIFAELSEGRKILGLWSLDAWPEASDGNKKQIFIENKMISCFFVLRNYAVLVKAIQKPPT